MVAVLVMDHLTVKVVEIELKILLQVLVEKMVVLL